MIDSSLILDFALQEVARSCQGLKRRCTHCCMGIIDAGEGDTHMRAVGVNEPAAGLTWMWAGARLATAAGAGCLRWLVSTTPASASSPRLRARAPAPGADVRLPRARAGASTCPGCRRRAALLYKCTFCSSTVPTDCTTSVRQREIKWLCPDCIPARFSGQTRHFGSITSLLPVFPHYYHHYYLLEHHYYIHYYIVITSLLHIITVIMASLLPIITFIITLLLLIITSVITSLLHIITCSLLPIITVIMGSLLLIITRSIMGNNGSIITHYRPPQLGDADSVMSTFASIAFANL